MAKKSLGQHWLKSESALENIVRAADLKKSVDVLEIGPGHGALTKRLLDEGANVIAIELDDELAANLAGTLQGQTLQTKGGTLTVVHDDILNFNLNTLPKDYKVVANIPYFITGKIVQMLIDSENPPSSITLLIQREVAERIASGPGNLSILAVITQLFGEVELREIVPAAEFDPPPLVDSQIVSIYRHVEPLFPNIEKESFYRLVKAGFSQKRKKLRSSLAGGLHIQKTSADALLASAGISLEARAQDLSLSEWYELWKKYKS